MIACAIWRIFRHILCGPSYMRVEHLQEWIVEVTRYQYLETGNWGLAVDLVQTYFRYCTILADFMWQTVFLLPMVNVDYSEIVLIKVLWKIVLGLINHRIWASITYHDIIYGFWGERGMATASFESKMLQQLT